MLERFQLQVDSADDHDKTREYVWKRSNMIAHLVSQKLTFAAKSMLTPAAPSPPPKTGAAKSGLTSAAAPPQKTAAVGA